MLPTILYIYKEGPICPKNNRSLPTSALASYQAPYHQVSSIGALPSMLNNAIGYVLSGMLEKDVKDGVPGKRGGQELYKALKAKYTASTRARRVAARKTFYQCSHDFPTQSLEQFIVEVRAKAQVLKDMGITISDTEILDVILMNIHHAFISTTTILAQTTESKLNDAISTLTSSPALNVDVIKKEEYSPSPLLAANAARGSRVPRHPDGRQANLTGGWVDDKGYRWCNVNGDDCHRSLAVMEAEGEHQHLAQSAFGVYTIPARRLPSPAASCSPSPPLPSADDADDDAFNFSGAGGSWGAVSRLYT
ncbi:uncharacterized protein SCHCODRAFT_02589293 [Schizophyllum commune H4-8]|nr:uncharacterized protein SCHCODRAFT_02589293 [Schizophyllum commune H4-8]KAI5887753.1 hypothetical protein SCHCODRAFT_02589293 [Schizophyllum commune H4-8]